MSLRRGNLHQRIPTRFGTEDLLSPYISLGYKLLNLHLDPQVQELEYKGKTIPQLLVVGLLVSSRLGLEEKVHVHWNDMTLCLDC